MANRRERDRDDLPRNRPHKEPARAAGPPLEEYFLSGEGIDRQVLQSSICRFLGPEATCKPYEHEGVPGYKIRAVRAFTPEMLHDLKDRSREYQSENSARKISNRDEVPYEVSQTRTRRDAPDMDMDIDYQPPRSRGPLSPAGPIMGYTAAPYMSEGPMPYAYSAPYSQSYPHVNVPTSAGPGLGYPPVGYSNNPGYYPPSRDGPMPASQMPYGYSPVQPGYGEPSRMGVDNYVFPTEPPRLLEHRDVRDMSHLRDLRGDPRDPRGDPRDGRDPRGTRDSRDSRDSRDPRDPRYGMHDSMSGVQPGVPQHRDPRDPRDTRTSGSYDQPPRDLYNRPPQRR